MHASRKLWCKHKVVCETSRAHTVTNFIQHCAVKHVKLAYFWTYEWLRKGGRKVISQDPRWVGDSLELGFVLLGLRQISCASCDPELHRIHPTYRHTHKWEINYGCRILDCLQILPSMCAARDIWWASHTEIPSNICSKRKSSQLRIVNSHASGRIEAKWRRMLHGTCLHKASCKLHNC